MSKDGTEHLTSVQNAFNGIDFPSINSQVIGLPDLYDSTDKPAPVL